MTKSKEVYLDFLLLYFSPSLFMFMLNDVGMALGHKAWNGREWMCLSVLLRENKIPMSASRGWCVGCFVKC